MFYRINRFTKLDFLIHYWELVHKARNNVRDENDALVNKKLFAEWFDFEYDSQKIEFEFSKDKYF